MTPRVAPRPDLGYGHLSHPLLGRLVEDTATGEIGVLRAVTREKHSAPGWVTVEPATVVYRAWLCPVGGGTEWTTSPDAIRAAE